MIKLNLWIAAWAIALGALLPNLSRATAQDAVIPELEDLLPAETGPPIATVNVAGLDRVLSDADYLFDTIQRPDVRESVDTLLGYVSGLKGMDRTRPFGIMVYLKPALIPQPTGVMYLPVTDPLALAKSIEVGRVTVKKTAEDRYEIVRGRDPLFVRVVGNYAFISNEELNLDREFGDPALDNTAVTTRYDVAVKLQPENIPPGMRDVLLGLVRQNVQADLQQRDDEPVTAFRLRRARAMEELNFFEQLLTQTRSAVLGLDASETARKAVFELVVEAVPGSTMAQNLKEIGGTPSSFASVFDDSVPASAIWSAPLVESTQEFWKAAVDDASRRIIAGLDNQPADDPELMLNADPLVVASVERFFEAPKAAIETGHVDAFAQFDGNQEDGFVLTGGVRVPDAESMEAPFRELIDMARARFPDAARRLNIDYGVGQAGGVTLHRIVGADEPREGEERFFKAKPAFYIGFGPATIWFAMGSSRAPSVLDEAVTRVQNSGPPEVGRIAPFQVVLNAKRWIGLNPNDPNNDIATEAFSPDNDTLSLDLRPTENGFRARLSAEEGFIRLIGLAIAKRFDERSNRN